MSNNSKHEILEKNVGLMALCMVLAVSIGGLVQIVPLFFQKETTQPVEGLKPYTALQLEGRDIYIKEGCVSCHSQMIRRSAPRPSATATTRLPVKACGTTRSCGVPSGPVRTWPRVGSRYSDDWHRAHLYNPRNVVPESKMPLTRGCGKPARRQGHRQETASHAHPRRAV